MIRIAKSIICASENGDPNEGGKRMRKVWLSIILTIVCLIPACVCAQVDLAVIPSELLQVYREQNIGNTPKDYIGFTTPDGVQHAFMITGDGWGLYGYENKGSGWEFVRGGSVLYSGATPRFVPHNTQSTRANGETYPDAYGFDVLAEAGGVCESYHYNGEAFMLCGWVDAQRYHGSVIIDGTKISYYPFGGSQAECTVDAGDELTLFSWTVDYERHPATPEEALERAALLPEAVADGYPGYTLLSHDEYNGGTEASSGYYRIEDGMLTMLYVSHDANDGRKREWTSMPVPLSKDLLARFESEPAENLIDTSGNGSFFRTEHPLDTSQIPIKGKIVRSDLQKDGLVLLTEQPSGSRVLYWVTLRENGNYFVRNTKPLPDDVSLDLFHADTDEISFEWDQQYRQAGYKLNANGEWSLEWVMNSEENEDFNYSLVYCGVKVENAWETGGNAVRIGTIDNASIYMTDLINLPQNEQEMSSCLNRKGWAVVHNPDPKDRLHLREAPDKNSASLGKFYNGTPVQVHADLGDWCLVSIGLDGNLEGYMMKRFLTFGADMDDVKCAYPQLVMRESYRDEPLYDAPDLRNETAPLNDEEYWVVGVVDDRLYIILTEFGTTGYVPQDWLFEGNG